MVKNICKFQKASKVAETRGPIRDVPGVIDKLRGSSIRIPAMVALFTGMRLGEVLALRWSRVDLDAGVIQVREALEQTAAHGIRFKSAKV